MAITSHLILKRVYGYNQPSDINIGFMAAASHLIFTEGLRLYQSPDIYRGFTAVSAA